eukprot:jgi/Chlat1/5675/Chrsp37S05489
MGVEEAEKTAQAQAQAEAEATGMTVGAAAAATVDSSTSSAVELFVSSELLSAVQLARVFPDSKTFVDMPLRLEHDPADVTAAFGKLLRNQDGTIEKDVLTAFVDKHFGMVGSDVARCTPADFIAKPLPEVFLPNVKDYRWRKFAVAIHNLWPLLIRKAASCVGSDMKPGQHRSLLALPSPMIVPGDRFGESYYWDSYWMVRGLLVSSMAQTARGVIMNLLHLIELYGFVPNGSRRYYLSRSQPPLLSSTVLEYYEATHDIELVRLALPLLRKEHKYWTSGKKAVPICHNNKLYELSRYWAATDSPRAESYFEDCNLTAGMSDKDKRALLREIATVAESGWDFSSRWRADHDNARTTQITRIVPVDLNVFLLRMESDIGTLHQLEGVTADRHFCWEYFHYAEARAEAINDLLWDSKKRRWRDLWLPAHLSGDNVVPLELCHRHPGGGVYASDFFPLWCDIAPPTGARTAPMDALMASGLLHTGGIAVSNVISGEQWDSPNVWAPIQCILVESMLNEKFDLAAELFAHSFLCSCLVAYEKTGHMHEKYDALTRGEVGAGGEYQPQLGFGWTNAVVLILLQLFGAPDPPD